MATEWVAVTEALVSDAMPSDLAPLYATWLSTYPAKAGTLARIVGDTVAQVRTAIRTNPANTLDDDTTKIPQDMRPACYDLITHRLAMEMGIDLESSANQVRQDADQLLRMVAYKHWIVESEDNTRSPIYTPPTAGTASTRTALPALIALALCLFPGPARAAWVNGTTVSDANVLMTYIPTNYTPGAGTLVGHAGGIDAKLKTLGGTGAVAEAYSAATAAVAQAAAAYSAATVAVALAGTAQQEWWIAPVTNADRYTFVNMGSPYTSWTNLYFLNLAEDAAGDDGRGINISIIQDFGVSPARPGITIDGYVGTNTYSGDLSLFGATNGDFLVFQDGWWRAMGGVNFSTYYTIASQQAAVTNYARGITTLAAPATPGTAGNHMELRVDTTNLYIYIAPSNKWLRIPGTFAW